MGIAIRNLILLGLTLFSIHSFAGSEIPWPYSSQQPMTEQNSKGLWWMMTENGQVLYNVELFDNSFGDSWMRVSELDPESYEVLSYGEGEYCNKEENDGGREGRFVYMFSHDKHNFRSYPLHVVEVNREWNFVLGFSIYGVKDEETHTLGYRMREKPLECYYPSKMEDLVCSALPAPSLQEK